MTTPPQQDDASNDLPVGHHLAAVKRATKKAGPIRKKVERSLGR
jgi:hypothetical protein